VTAEDPRCSWALGGDAGMLAYHDTEWGVPEHDDQRLFEFVILEGAQAGLSWQTILRKRPAYRAAFADFDPSVVAQFGEADRARLLNDAGIVRNRAKIASAISNAQAFLAVQDEFGSFDSYAWDFIGGTPLQNKWRRMGDLPATTPLAESMSKDLRRRGFNFVGPTIWYAHMQATGMVNDHLVTCPRHAEVASLA
jgi:DNA-3-methyladenine glycosylase I